MKLQRLLAAGLVALALPFATGCAHNAQPVRVTMQSLPPLSGRVKIETTIVPRSQKFKVAVLTFIDQTGRAEQVVDPIADMLTTELFAVKRFELYDRQDLVEQTHARAAGAGSNKTSLQYRNVSETGKVDGILLGYITSFKMNEAPAADAPPPPDPKKKGKPDPKAPAAAAPQADGSGEFSLDFRIVNTLAADRAAAKAGKNEGLKELVVFGDSAKVRFRMKGGTRNIELDRGDVAKIATAIKSKFPEFSERKITITSLQDEMVSLSVGEKDGVKQGFTGYVVKHDEKTGVNRYLAEFVIINVFKDAATAVVVPDSSADGGIADILANISVGSEAVIK